MISVDILPASCVLEVLHLVHTLERLSSELVMIKKKILENRAWAEVGQQRCPETQKKKKKYYDV